MIITLLVSIVFLILHCCSPTGSTGKPDYHCNWNGTDSLQFLSTIACPLEFEELSGPPYMPTLSNVQSVKIVYEIATNQLFFLSSVVYPLHYTFCRDVLGYTKSNTVFNSEQYSNTSERRYYLASINCYKSSGLFTLEFIPDDGVSAEGIRTTFNAAKSNVYFGDKLNFLAVSTRFQNMADSLSGIPLISKDQVYGEQIYQALNIQKAYGWLKRVSSQDILTAGLSRHDILVTDGLPVDVPVVAGIITTEFQTPLSHINILSHNRGTPNMALKTAWTDSSILQLSNKLVFLEVSADTFTLKEASATDAEEFWDSREPHTPITLECNDDTAGLFDMTELSHTSLTFIGAKAANFAELSKIRMGNDSLPVPENAFAIPFYYYRKHIRDNGIDSYIEKVLSDSLSAINYQRRILLLDTLRNKIIGAPLDTVFVSDVENKIRSMGTFQRMRFRSSTNAEDIESFNGAGLYDSYTGDLTDSRKSVAEAIKKTFASLWTLRGFDEREYFKIDQRSVAMGILVHRSFPDEEVNGVAITGNIYKPEVSAFTINAQIDEISIVKPPPGCISDQLLFYLYSNDAFDKPVIEYITTSNMNNKVPVMSESEIVNLAKWLNAIKRHFYFNVFSSTGSSYTTFSMDVEFKLDQGTRKLYIKQARPYQ